MATKKSPKSPPKKRIRKTAEDSRRAILDAAERQLGLVGPGGIRLQQIAREVGISHPAILHHFGSREELLQEVVRRAVTNLETELMRVITESRQGGEPPALETIEQAFHVLVEKGHARVVAWLLLSGHAAEPAASIRLIANAVHERRRADDPRAKPEDTLFRALLIALTLFGEAVAGPAMRRSAGLDGDPEAPRRFRRWLAELMVAPSARS